MSECEHTPHNWNLVYQCRGCGEIVHEEMAQKYEAANARELAELKREIADWRNAVDFDEHTNTVHFDHNKIAALLTAEESE